MNRGQRWSSLAKEIEGRGGDARGFLSNEWSSTVSGYGNCDSSDYRHKKLRGTKSRIRSERDAGAGTERRSEGGDSQVGPFDSNSFDVVGGPRSQRGRPRARGWNIRGPGSSDGSGWRFDELDVNALQWPNLKSFKEMLRDESIMRIAVSAFHRIKLWCA